MTLPPSPGPFAKHIREAVMPKKALFLLIIFIVAGGITPLPLAATAAKSNAFDASRIRKPSHPGPFFPRLCASTSEKKEQEDIEAQLKEILEQIKQLEKELDKKMQREILPRIREEMEKLREWLKKHKEDREEEKPQWTNRTPLDADHLTETASESPVLS